MTDFVFYQNDTLKINYLNYGKKGRNYSELFDFLGNFDIITASEIGQDSILMDNDVFLFTSLHEVFLRNNSFVNVPKISSLKDFIDYKNEDHIAFLKWYENK